MLAFDLRGQSRRFQHPHPPILVGGSNFAASLRFAFAATCRFARPPVGADQAFTQPTRTYTSGLPTDWSPSPPPDITTGATGQFPLAGLSPARTPTSFAAPLRSELCCLGPSSLNRPHAPHSPAHLDFTDTAYTRCPRCASKTCVA